jgi:AsmA protein
MKKTLTITGITLLIVSFLLASSALFLRQFADPNKFKGRISQYIFAKTGQVLVINGSMKWSIFPWIGLKADNLTYYNPAGFTPKTFLSAKEMDIKIKFIPLITGKIEIGNITLNKAVLNLIKNPKGEFNWQSLSKHSPEETKDRNIGNKPFDSTSKLSIASLKIKNGKLNWLDQQNNSQVHLTSLDISSKNVHLDSPFPLFARFDLLDDHKQKYMSLDFDSTIVLSPAYPEYSLPNFKIKATVYQEALKIPINIEGTAAYNQKMEKLLADLSFHLNNVSGNLLLHGNTSQKLHINGTLGTNSFNLKNLFEKLGKPIITKNQDSLSNVSILANIDFSDSNFAFTKLHAKIDRSDVYGSAICFAKNKNLQFDLSANQLALNDYLLKEEDSPKVSLKISNINKEKVKSSPWKIKGTIKVNQVTADKLKLSNVTATLAMNNQIMHISPLKAQFYKGQLVGDITFDKQRSTILINQNLKNVDIKELLSEFTNSNKLSGISNISANLTAKTGVLATMNGKINFALKNGSLRGIDMIYLISKAHAFIKRLPSPKLNDSKQTQFSSLTANIQVNNGVLNTNDLSLFSDYLKVNGKGSANLMTKDIRYRLNAFAQPKLAIENKQINREAIAYQIPIKISGKLTKPSINLDFVELTKLIYAKQIEKHLTKKIENINHLKDSLKQNIQNKVQIQLKRLTPSSLISRKDVNIDTAGNQSPE